MSRLDRALEALDAGLQTPMPDPSFGEISPTVEPGCVRCEDDVEEGEDICGPCRAFLLGDSELDPADGATVTVGFDVGMVPPAFVSEELAAELMAFAERAAAAFGLAVEQAADTLRRLADSYRGVGEAAEALGVTAEELVNAPDPMLVSTGEVHELPGEIEVIELPGGGRLEVEIHPRATFGTVSGTEPLAPPPFMSEEFAAELLGEALRDVGRRWGLAAPPAFQSPDPRDFLNITEA